MTDAELIERIKREGFHKIFQRSSKGVYLYYGTVDGIKIAVVRATKNNPNFETFALNKHDLGDLAIPYKASGKIDKVFVLQTESRDLTLGDYINGEELYEKVKDAPTRTGSLGEFWTSPDFRNFGDEDPFKSPM